MRGQKVEKKKYLKKLWLKNPKFIEKELPTHSGSSTNFKQNKGKEIHKYLTVKMLQVKVFDKSLQGSKRKMTTRLQGNPSKISN